MLGNRKTVKHESDDYSNGNWCSWYSYQTIGTGTGNKRTSRNHLNYSVVKTGQNTEKSPEELMKLAVTPQIDHQLTLM